MKIHTLFILLITLAFSTPLKSQEQMTPELLWSLNRVSAVGLSNDKTEVVFSVTRYQANKNAKPLNIILYRLLVVQRLPLRIIQVW